MHAIPVMDTIPTDLQRLAAALHYAAHHHRNQRRKNQEQWPYINHPIGLLHVLAVEAHITDAEVLCAAVLHDVIEDCGRNAAERAERAVEIEQLFGVRVRKIVEEVSDDKTRTKAERKRHQVEHARHLSHAAKLVKLADKTMNLRDVAGNPPAGWPLRRRREYFDWANKVAQAIGPAHAVLRRLFDQAFAARP
jgi:GTP diphosphokinase / guanosine-3',5'-bis(diphosphate) 3'-diphosphatase